MQTTETDRKAQPMPKRFPLLRLLFSAGVVYTEGQRRALAVGDTCLGRDVPEGEGISLSDDTRASRRHATLRVSADGTRVELRDEHSKNGSFVNGERVTRRLLNDGDVIRIGSSLLLLRQDADPLSDAEAPQLLGDSPAIRALRHRISEVAPRDATVLLLGESGTGKEVCAQALHRASRRPGCFLAVNCAAIPSELAESQLFGHTAGAFSGARAAHAGFFRTAEQGTLFLDEIGDMPLPLQAKLLRVLEERAVLPVGGTRPLPCDVRLVAATNADLKQAVATQRFRGDLYARLSAVVLQLPPLRARREDILTLLLHGLRSPRRLSARLAEALVLYAWPYNVREVMQLADELRSHGAESGALDLPAVAERLNVDAQPGPLGNDPDEDAPRDELSDSERPSEASQRLSRETLVRLLQEHEGAIAAVARAVGRSRRQVSRWLADYGLRRKDFLK